MKSGQAVPQKSASSLFWATARFPETISPIEGTIIMRRLATHRDRNPLTIAGATFSQDELPAAPQRRQPAGPRCRAAGRSSAPETRAYRQQVSYAIGQNFAENLRDNEIEVGSEVAVAGLATSVRAPSRSGRKSNCEPAHAAVLAGNAAKGDGADDPAGRKKQAGSDGISGAKRETRGSSDDGQRAAISRAASKATGHRRR